MAFNKIQLMSKLKKVFKEEDSRFILKVGLKVSGISLAITFFIYWFLFEVMRLNYAFFKANGFPQFNNDNPFYDHILKETVDNIPVLFAFHIFLFFIGTYIGWLMLRPFRTMGEYCEKVMDTVDSVYKIDEFSTYTLFTRFSEFFFEFLRESRKKGQLSANSIPPQYLKIHRPELDRIFMLHFGILLVIISTCSALFIIENTSSVFSSMVELATTTLKDQKGVTKFFSAQSFVLEDIVVLTIATIIISYTFLGLHLYSKVSGAAFAIFSTMRAYMKGNYSSRVHLVGFNYLREHTRKLNKYLEYIQNNFAKEQTKN